MTRIVRKNTDGLSLSVTNNEEGRTSNLHQVTMYAKDGMRDIFSDGPGCF